MNEQTRTRFAERSRAFRQPIREMADQAGRVAFEARARADDLVGTIDRARIPERARSYPFAAMAAAFGVGFLLAGQSDNRVLRTAKGQLRNLLIAGVIASLREEAESLIRDEIAGLVRKRNRD